MSQQKDPELLSFIARRLKMLREENKLSQQEVTNDTDIHIGRIETGKLNITVSTLSTLCKYYKVTLSEFFTTVD